MSNYYLCKLPLILFLCISLLSPNSVNSQQPELVDSLRQELATSNSDSVQSILLVKLCQLHFNLQPDIAIEYAQKILVLGEKTNTHVNTIRGNHYIGSILIRQGKTKEASLYLLKAIDICRQENIAQMLPGCLNNMGMVYNTHGEWAKSMECFKEGLSILEADKNIPSNKKITLEILNNIGILHAEQKNYKQAKNYYEQVYEKTKELNDSIGISIALTNIGEILYEQGENEDALAHYSDALTISKRIDDAYGVVYLYTNMGIIHFDKGEFKIAEKYLFLAMDIANELNVPDQKIRIYRTLAGIEQSQKKYSSANSYCQKGLILAKAINNKSIIKDLYQISAQTYKLQKNYKQAFIYHELFKEVNDTLFNEEKNRQITELSIQYETNKKEAENNLLKEEQAKNKALLKQRTILNWTIFLFLGLVSVIAYSLYVNNKRKQKYNILLEVKVEERTNALKNANAKLERSNKDLEQFAYITSHDLKEPLRNISSFATLISQKFGNTIDKEAKEYISFIQKNTIQMDALIEGILGYARIKKVDNYVGSVDLNETISKLKDILKNTIDENNVQIYANHLPTVEANPSQMFIVLKNLIENAIKYNTSQQPTIHLSSEQIGKMYHIEVKDNGIGINKEYQKKIFTIFKRLHNRSTYNGVGIGLSTCRKIVQHYGGEIWVKSKEGEGSRFTFSVPTGKTL